MFKPEISISIDGKALTNFSSFTLTQVMQDHHSFQLVVGHEVIEELGSHVMEKSQKWIGKTLESILDKTKFIGIITSVNMSHFHGMHGELIIKGYSPTILMEAGPHKQSWNDKSLKNIVEDTLGAAKVKGAVKPKFTSSITYMAQYRETHFEFLKRLAGTYHEWLFYDGTKLCFGKPGSLPEVAVVYGIDLDNIEISMRMAPVAFEGFSYKSSRDEVLNTSSSGSVSGLNDLGNEAFNASKANFGKTRSAIAVNVKDKSELDTHLNDKSAAGAANLVWLSGRGTGINLRPGVIAKIEATKREDGSWSSYPYGEYLVMRVEHHVSSNHEYTNHFEAIPANLAILPSPGYSLPIAEPQVATVLSNDDPDKQGRVQVRMLWQNGSAMMSPWIRVMTPDAGSSGNVGTNRGFVFIPEAGDQVMVGFRYNDPSRPYVMGSLFHGMVGGGGGGANATKSLTTRSGSTITLNDDEGAGSITISDPSGNKVVMKGDGTMEITAPNKLDINSTEINITAGKNINVQAGMNINEAAGMSIATTAGMNVSTSAGLAIEQAAGIGLSMAGGRSVGINAGGGSSMDFKSNGITKLQSRKKIEFDSNGKMDLKAKQKAVLSAKNIDVAGQSKTTVKGSKVQVQ